MRNFFTSGRRRYALLLLLVGVGSLAIMGNSCAPAPTKPPAPEPTGLSIDPTEHDFGSQPVIGGPTDATTFTVTNHGPGSSGTLSVIFDSFNPIDFQGTNDTCTAANLDEVGETCSIDIVFNPLTVGPKQADVTVSGDTGFSATAVVSGFGDT